MIAQQKEIVEWNVYMQTQAYIVIDMYVCNRIKKIHLKDTQ